MQYSDWMTAVRDERVAKWFDGLGASRAEKDASLREHLTDWYQQAVALNPTLGAIGLAPEIDSDLLDAVVHVFMAHGVELNPMEVANRTTRLQDAFRQIANGVARARLAGVWRPIITAIDMDTFDEPDQDD